MILVCPDCHWGILLETSEAEAQGEASSHSCQECEAKLSTLNEAFHVGLSSASEAAESINDEHLLTTVKQEPLRRPSSEEFPRGMEEPPGQMVIGDGLKDFDNVYGGLEFTSGDTKELATRDNTLPSEMEFDLNPDATHLALHRPANRAPKKDTGSKGAIGLALGCGTVGFVLLIVAGLIIGFFYFVEDPPSPKGKKATATKEKEEAQPAPPPINEQIQDLLQDHSSTSVSAIKLPGTLPSQGDLILLTPNGVVFAGEMVATFNVGDIDPNYKPSVESPLILPLANQLEDSFTQRIKDVLDEEAEPRRVLVLGDGTVPYSVVYSTLYTAWSRGAHLQLVTKNPANPNAYVTVEATGDNWPAPIQVGSPENLSPQNPARSPLTDAKVMTVWITQGGFKIKAADQPDGDEIEVEKITVFPIQKLKRACREVRSTNEDITAVRIVPSPKTTLFTLIQTIGALSEPWDGSARLNEIRLAAPK